MYSIPEKKWRVKTRLIRISDYHEQGLAGRARGKHSRRMTLSSPCDRPPSENIVALQAIEPPWNVRFCAYIVDSGSRAQCLANTRRLARGVTQLAGKLATSHERMPSQNSPCTAGGDMGRPSKCEMSYDRTVRHALMNDRVRETARYFGT